VVPPAAQAKTFNTDDTEKSDEIRMALTGANACSVIPLKFRLALFLSDFSIGRAVHFKYVRTVLIKSSAASSADFVLRGMWLRMWSSINSPMRLLMAPRAEAQAEAQVTLTSEANT
jgi:hypothetical protein